MAAAPRFPPEIAFCAPLLPTNRTWNPLRQTSTRPHPYRAQPARRRRTNPVATFSPRPPGQHQPNRAPDYYANVGTVIDTLRSDVPAMLHRTPEMSIYTDHLTFSDGSGYWVTGKEAYKTVLWLLRAQTRLVFTSAFVEIQSMYHDDPEGCVYLRWRMTANPRWSNMGRCVIDGMSVYRLDSCGLVYEHSLENSAKRRDRRVVFDKLTVAHVREGRVVGAGAGVGGGLPGWYRTLFEDAELVPMEQVEEREVEKVW